jgi:hypothetical protein
MPAQSTKSAISKKKKVSAKKVTLSGQLNHLDSVRTHCVEKRWNKDQSPNDGDESITSSGSSNSQGGTAANTSMGSVGSDYGQLSGLAKIIDSERRPQFNPESNLVVNLAALEKMVTTIADHQQDCCNLKRNNTRCVNTKLLISSKT